MRGGQDAGRAETALQRVMFLEACSERPKCIARSTRQSFDRYDMRAFSLRGQHEAGADRRTVNNHGARPAYSMLTADVGPGELKMVAERISKAGPRFDVNFDR